MYTMLSRINDGGHVFGSTCCDSSKLSFLFSDSKFPSARIHAWVHTSSQFLNWFVFFFHVTSFTLYVSSVVSNHNLLQGENKMYYKH